MEDRDFTRMFLYSLAVQLLAVFFIANFIAAQVEVPSYEPFGNTSVGEASLNAFSLIIPPIIFTLVLIVLLKFFGLKVFTYLISAFPLLIIFLVNPMFVSTAVGNYFPDVADVVAIATTFLLMGMALYSTLRRVQWMSSFTTLVLASEVGSLFALMLQPPTLFLVPLAFALYDIYAVFAGPLKVFIKQLTKSYNPKTKKPGIRKVRQSLNLGIFAANVGGFTLGTGDLVFYSLIACAAFIIGGITGLIATLAALNAGVIITFMLLTKYKKVLPGLPIPVFLGVASLLVFFYLV